MNTEKSQYSAGSLSKLELRNMLLQAFLPPPTQGRGGNHFPDVAVTSHSNQTYRFHSDLISNKIAMVQFMSLDAQEKFPSLNHLAKVAEQLGDQLGKQVQIYSVTTQPEVDTVERLAEYAEKNAIPAGWLLLRPSSDDSKAISDRFARHLSNHHHQHTGINTRMVHYGNGSVGIWGAFAVDADPEMAVTRVSWLQPGAIASSEIKRAGPAPLWVPGQNVNSNRDI